MIEAIETYLAVEMATLCGNRNVLNEDDLEAHHRIEALGLFDVATAFERFADVLGVGAVSSPRMIADAPKSLRVSIEHRYTFLRWPAFDFIILESEEGIAWGHAFVRRSGAAIPVIRALGDLARWSHVEAEVRAALGEGQSREGWPPWESVLYEGPDGVAALCYVYGLLQSVQTTKLRNGKNVSL